MSTLYQDGVPVDGVSTASDLPTTDAGGYYSSSSVEGNLQEAGASIASLQSTVAGLTPNGATLYAPTFADLSDWTLTEPADTTITPSSSTMLFSRAGGTNTMVADLLGTYFNPLPLRVQAYLNLNASLPTSARFEMRVFPKGDTGTYLSIGAFESTGAKLVSTESGIWKDNPSLPANGLWVSVLLFGYKSWSAWYSTNSEGDEPTPDEWTQLGSDYITPPRIIAPQVRFVQVDTTGALSSYVKHLKVKHGY